MEYLVHILGMAGIYVILAVGLNLAVGYAGIPAMGQSAFFCIGSYASAIMALRIGISPWVTIMVAPIIAGTAGWFVSLTASRLNGDFLALATFGFAVVVHSIAINWTDLTRGPMGIPGIPSFEIFQNEINTAWEFFPLIALGVFCGVFIARRIVDSPYGRILQGIRESETVTLSLGRDTSKYKQSIFAVAACYAGLAGALYAHYISYINPSSFTPIESFTILLMVVFGGMGSTWGAVVGASILVLLPEAFRFLGMPDSIAAPIRQMLYGAVLVVLMLVRPQGLLGKFKWR